MRAQSVGTGHSDDISGQFNNIGVVTPGFMRSLLRRDLLKPPVAIDSTCCVYGDGKPINHPLPGSVMLAPSDVGGHSVIRAKRGGQSQVAADHRGLLLSHLKPFPPCDEFAKELTNCAATVDQSVSAIQQGLVLVQSGDPVDVASVHSRDQQALQILRV